ncbi:hypothetical protein [Suttonella ornithocola]|uniref:hypothetical protein n=1 Tax=Suttonella ornithocola TaxID=279832 RepID=UPI001559B8A2|nr:hypothetical protein [Suttonella ornithocola]
MIRKRTSADIALFLCLQFLWQCAWENLRVRRFFRSGSSNPARAVALLFGTNGDSYPKLRKETVMSEQFSPSAELVLHGITITTDFDSAIDHSLALIRLMSIASENEDRALESHEFSLICELLENQLYAVKESVSNYLYAQLKIEQAAKGGAK